MKRKRVLFVAESITSAQVVRLVKLAQALDPTRYEVHFASGAFSELIFAQTGFRRHHLETLSPARVERLLESGRRLYGPRILRRYFEAERELIVGVEPALCVGDFRWTLSTTAETLGVPCATLINAYWSPHAERPEGWPLPDHFVIRVLGERLSAKHFPQAIAHVFRHFTAPLNALRRSLGLKPLHSLPEVLCHGDLTLYADHPYIVPVRGAPEAHRYLGVVDWEPSVPIPSLRGPPGDPLVYATLGSSGKWRALEPLAQALGGLPVRVLLSMAGREGHGELPANFTVAPFVPGSRAAALARLVISNGGSTTGYQALAQGTPVFGLPSNLDQFLACQAMARTGASVYLPARNAQSGDLRAQVMAALESETLRRAAERARAELRQLDSATRFREIVGELVGVPPFVSRSPQSSK